MKQHIKTSFGSIRRAPFQALAAISVLGVTFFVATLLSLVIYASGQILNYFETRPQIIAFLTEDATQGEVDNLRESLEDDNRIKSVSFVSKEDALEIYRNATIDNPQLSELINPSVFPASLEFSVSDLVFAEEIIEEVRGESIVDEVGFTASLGGESTLGEVIERLRTISLYVRIGGVVAVTILGVTSLIVLMVVIGMRIAVRKSEIESLSLLGATPWFIRAPILLEAVNYAIVGAVIGWALATVTVMYSTPSILDYFGEVPVLPRESMSFFSLLGLILAAELVAGIAIGILGSLFAVSRSLRSTR